MAWTLITVDGVVGWEYSNAPNTDKKANDTYDYDLHTDHVDGIVTKGNVTKCVLARQVNHPHPGYGEMKANGLTGGGPPVDTYTFQNDTDYLLQDGSAFELN